MFFKISIPIFTCLFYVAPVCAISQQQAQHLLNRSSFSADPDTTITLQQFNYSQAVDYLLSNTHDKAITHALKIPTINLKKRFKDLTAKQKKERNKLRRQQIMQLQGWWINEMITTPSALTEVMTLFWHNHFTSSAQKVRSATLMQNQNSLLRKHALGNFSTLLHSIAQDPAMVIYLDNANNKKGSPNENFAREVMELFTLGEGYYSETDIKQAAIAFTGWGVKRKTGSFQFREHLHDNQKLQVLDQPINESGLNSGKRVLDILLQHPQTAVYLSKKLYKHFISHDNIDKNTITQLATVLRNENYNIKPWLRALFLSQAFQKQQQTGSLIKSPIDLIIGTYRALSIPTDNPRLLAKASKRLGQELFNPPNVKGWPGGHDWITTDTFIVRKSLLNKLLREKKDVMMSTSMMRSPPNLLVTKDESTSIKAQLLNPAYQVK